MYVLFLEWLKDNQIGDLTGVIGLIISVIGFAVSIVGIYKSKTAAESAAQAAKNAQESVKLFQTVVDFTEVINVLEDIKRSHRSSQWQSLPDRYSIARKTLISLNTTNTDLTDDQRTSIQNAVTNLASLEREVETNLSRPENLKSAKFNSIVSQDLDNLIAVLAELKVTKTGV